MKKLLLLIFLISSGCSSGVVNFDMKTLNRTDTSSTSAHTILSKDKKKFNIINLSKIFYGIEISEIRSNIDRILREEFYIEDFYEKEKVIWKRKTYGDIANLDFTDVFIENDDKGFTGIVNFKIPDFYNGYAYSSDNYSQKIDSLSISATFKDGILDGEFSVKFEDGKLSEKAFFKNGLLNGTVERYLKVNSGNIADLQKTTSFFDKEILYEKYNYKDGLLDGEYIRYGFPVSSLGQFEFTKDNLSKTIEQKSLFSNGVRDGLTEIFDLEGNLLISKQYNNGLLDGNSYYYSDNEDGNSSSIYFTKKYENGRLTKTIKNAFTFYDAKDFVLNNNIYGANQRLITSKITYFPNEDEKIPMYLFVSQPNDYWMPGKDQLCVISVFAEPSINGIEVLNVNCDNPVTIDKYWRNLPDYNYESTIPEKQIVYYAGLRTDGGDYDQGGFSRFYDDELFNLNEPTINLSNESVLKIEEVIVGEKAYFTLNFKNKGSKSLKIKKIKTDKLLKIKNRFSKDIPPNESLLLEIELLTSNLKGTKEGYTFYNFPVTIEHNSPFPFYDGIQMQKQYFKTINLIVEKVTNPKKLEMKNKVLDNRIGQGQIDILEKWKGYWISKKYGDECGDSKYHTTIWKANEDNSDYEFYKKDRWYLSFYEGSYMITGLALNSNTLNFKVVDENFEETQFKMKIDNNNLYNPNWGKLEKCE